MTKYTVLLKDFKKFGSKCFDSKIQNSSVHLLIRHRCFIFFQSEVMDRLRIPIVNAQDAKYLEVENQE